MGCQDLLRKEIIFNQNLAFLSISLILTIRNKPRAGLHEASSESWPLEGG